jgi:hypothetical protein
MKDDIKIITKAINFIHKEKQKVSSGLLGEGDCLYKCLYFVFTNFIIREVK